MRIGLILPLFSGEPERVLSFADRAEALGFDGVFAFDHLFPPGAPADRPSLEAFTMLAAVASRTRRVAVGTLVTRAPLRSAGMIAKLSATIDDVSGGRMILGIGAGEPDNPEHRVFGIDASNDVHRYLAEAVRCIRALFEGRPWPGGSFVPATAGPLLPRPRIPPIWIGGSSEHAARLAAAEADAWNGWQLGIDGFERRVSLLRRESAGRAVDATWAGVALVGRDDDDLARLLDERARAGRTDGTWTGTASSLRTWLDELERAGATWAVLAVAGPRDRIELIGSEVLPYAGSRT